MSSSLLPILYAVDIACSLSSISVASSVSYPQLPNMDFPFNVAMAPAKYNYFLNIIVLTKKTKFYNNKKTVVFFSTCPTLHKLYMVF